MATSKETTSSKKKKSSSKTFKYGFKKRAEEIALDYRKKLGVETTEPLDSFKLANYLNLEVLTLNDLPGASEIIIKELLHTDKSKQWSGFIIGYDKPTLIVYNSSHSKARIESTIMHECAHAILGHPMTPIDSSLEIPRNEYPIEQESEAEWLAGCLLLPKVALIKYYINQNLLPLQIAGLFNLSEKMINYRVQVSGVKRIKDRMNGKKY
jgi:Zn-dependent peptidase ImmA (M78 family)